MMLNKVIAELVTDRITVTSMRLDQKFTVEFKVRTTKKSDECKLLIEVMQSGILTDARQVLYKVKMAGNSMPINVTGDGLRAVIQATLMQFKVVDFASSDRWFSILPRTLSDYDRPQRRVGDTTGLYRLRLAR